MKTKIQQEEKEKKKKEEDCNHFQIEKAKKNGNLCQYPTVWDHGERSFVRRKYLS